ncbi:MAG: glycosyltransferase family 2 protein [Desulfuromonas sp.]
MESETLISIVIPAYNYAASLPRAINSVIAQIGEQHELIVVDDGSTDDTQVVLEQCAKELRCPFEFFYKENGGPGSARNFAISKSKGEYLVFLDADDELAPDALNLLEQHIKNNPDTRMVIGCHIAIDPDGKQRKYVPRSLPDSSYARVKGYLIDKKIALSNGACAMHRDIFARGLYPEKFRSVEDIPVFAQALAHYPCSILQHPLALIHKHSDSLRHQFNYAKEIGLDLVDEVFSSARLGQEFLPLKKDFHAQRCLSLFRSAYVAKDFVSAKNFFYVAATRSRLAFKWSYLSKYLRLLFKIR